LPDISKDGSLIAYSESVDCNSLPEALKLLPPGQVKMIRYYAERTKSNILAAGGLTDDKFPFPEEGLLLPLDYRNWAIRYLCENADSELREVLPKSEIEKGRQEAISYCKVVVAPVKNLVDKRIVTVSVLPIMATQLSPDCKSVAYLMHTQKGRVSDTYEEFGLYVASLETDIEAMFVEFPVAAGYDWQSNSRTIAYLSADSEDLRNNDTILGTLNERIVADANGMLLAEPMQSPERGTPATHSCTGKNTQSAGTVFYPWLKAAYGPENRIFFSSIAMPLPLSMREEPRCSLFCYDPLTATVTDVLPPSVSSYTSQQIIAVSQFSLSPDGKRVLLPIEKNRFMVYALGSDSAEFPIPQEEGFGEKELPEMVPSWKGNDEIAFQVAGDSHFLAETRDESKKPDRREIVVLSTTDDKNWILSADWGDEILKNSEGDN
jgi:hypothetical protein